VSQTPVDSEGKVLFDVEFCALDEDVTITMTATDECGITSSDEIEVTVVGEDCLSFFCQKNVFAFDEEGSLELNVKEYMDYSSVENLCQHVSVDLSYSSSDINDTLMVYNCDQITPMNLANIQDSIFYWSDGKVIDFCRVIVFISNDPNDDGATSDGWQELCGF